MARNGKLVAALLCFAAFMALTGFAIADLMARKGVDESTPLMSASGVQAGGAKAHNGGDVRYRLRSDVDLTWVSKKSLKEAKAFKRRLVDLGLEDIYFATTAGPHESIWDWNRQTGYGVFNGPTNGVTFRKVRAGSAFAKAGLKSGDLIASVDRQITWPCFLLNPRSSATHLLNDEIHLLAMFGPLVKSQGKSTWQVMRPIGSTNGWPTYKELTLTVTLP